MCYFKLNFAHFFYTRDSKMKFTLTFFSILEQDQRQAHYIVVSKSVVLKAADLKSEGHSTGLL